MTKGGRGSAHKRNCNRDRKARRFFSSRLSRLGLLLAITAHALIISDSISDHWNRPPRAPTPAIVQPVQVTLLPQDETPRAAPRGKIHGPGKRLPEVIPVSVFYSPSNSFLPKYEEATQLMNLGGPLLVPATEQEIRKSKQAEPVCKPGGVWILAHYTFEISKQSETPHFVISESFHAAEKICGSD